MISGAKYSGVPHSVQVLGLGLVLKMRRHRELLRLGDDTGAAAVAAEMRGMLRCPGGSVDAGCC